KSFEATGETTEGLLDWLGQKTLNRFGVNWNYSPNTDFGGRLSGAWDLAKQKASGFMGGLSGMFSRGPADATSMYGAQATPFQPMPTSTPFSPDSEEYVSSLADWASQKGKRSAVGKSPKQLNRDSIMHVLNQTLSRHLTPEETQRAMDVAQSQDTEDLQNFLHSAASAESNGTKMQEWILGDFGTRFGPIRGVINWASDAASGLYNRVGSFFGGISDYMSHGAGSLRKFVDFVGSFGLDVNPEWLEGYGQNLLGCLQNLFPTGTEHPGANDFRANYLLKFMISFPHLSMPEFFYPKLSLSELLRKMVGLEMGDYSELWERLMGMLSEEEIAAAMDNATPGNLSSLVTAATKAKLLALIQQGRQEDIRQILGSLAEIYNYGPMQFSWNVELTSEEWSLSGEMNLEQLFAMIMMGTKNISAAVQRIGRMELLEMLSNTLSREALYNLDAALAENPEDYNRLIRIAISQTREIDGDSLRNYIRERINQDLDSINVDEIISHDFYGSYFMDYLLEAYA
ncbi:hypothetical protein PSACC_00302, partial [Paramicrosporidium saccamoebae]